MLNKNIEKKMAKARKEQRAAKAARTLAPTFEMSLDNITFSDAVALMPVELKAEDFEFVVNDPVSGGKKSSGRAERRFKTAMKNRSRYGKARPSREERKTYKEEMEWLRSDRLYNGQNYCNGRFVNGIKAAKMALDVADAYAELNKPSGVTLDEEGELTLATEWKDWEKWEKWVKWFGVNNCSVIPDLTAYEVATLADSNKAFGQELDEVAETLGSIQSHLDALMNSIG